MKQTVIQLIGKGTKIPAKLKKMMDHNKELCLKAGIAYAVIKFGGGENPAAASEPARIALLEKRRNIIIVDWDIKLLEIPVLEDLVYASYTENGNPYNAILANGNNTRFFRAWRKWCERNEPLAYGKCNGFLRRNTPEKFPGAFEHSFHTLPKKRGQHVKEDAGDKVKPARKRSNAKTTGPVKRGNGRRTVKSKRK